MLGSVPRAAAPWAGPLGTGGALLRSSPRSLWAFEKSGDKALSVFAKRVVTQVL